MPDTSPVLPGRSFLKHGNSFGLPLSLLAGAAVVPGADAVAGGDLSSQGGETTREPASVGATVRVGA